MRLAACFLAAGLWLASAGSAWCKDFVGGDSIGLGIAAASGVTGYAKSSSAIFNGHVLRQLKNIPDGSRLYLSLGTNDAVWQTEPSRKRFNILIDAMREKKLAVVWVGPPCVLPEWSRNIPGFDAKLGEMVRDSGFAYVSLYEFAGCRLPRLEDGVHFTFSGYKAIWQHISALDLKQAPEASAPPPDLPMPPAEAGPVLP